MHRPRVRLELARQQLEQRRLAGPVRTDEADAIAAQDALRVVAHDADEAGSPERLGHVVRLEDEPARRLAGIDRQTHVPARRPLGRTLRAKRHAARARGPRCAFAAP